MKTTLKILLLLSLVLYSCKEPTPVITHDFDFIIKEKVELNGEYYIRSTDDMVEQCSAEQFIGWDVGDTIPMMIYQNGLLKGATFLK